jgi:hypothetical protein
LRVFRGRRDPPVPLRPVSLLDGKEGVDGSSPSEGFAEMPANGLFDLSRLYTPITRGHSRALAGVPSPAWVR